LLVTGIDALVAKWWAEATRPGHFLVVVDLKEEIELLGEEIVVVGKRVAE
jgi:hypothetical protein